MKLICDCFDMHHLDLYKNSGIDRILVSMPLVSVRPVRVYKKDEVIQIVTKAHQLNLEVGVNMLNFMMEEEIDVFKDTLLFCKENKIDRIYYADMGVYQLAKELQMVSLLIYQPSTLIASSLDANHYLNLGIDRVVLSREITFDETKQILDRCHGCEVSVFGYNPMMHSKRRLLSSYFEFIGVQDQSHLKNLYLMEENRTEKMPVFQDKTGTHVLSGSVFCNFAEIKEFMNCDFRIEGLSLNEELILQVAKDIYLILTNKKDGKECFEEYRMKYPEYNITNGFMYKKTSLVKEDCS